MKKKTILIVITSIVLISIIFASIDYFRTRADKLPIFAIRTNQYRDGGSADYIGLGYKIIKCNTLSGDKSFHFGFYNISVDNVCNNDPNYFTIVDETEMCATALELVYADDDYKYYFECIKSDTVFIVFEDGTRMSISVAKSISYVNWLELVVSKYPELFIKEINLDNFSFISDSKNYESVEHNTGGVKKKDFNNVDIVKINNKNEAIERAQKEVTVSYNQTSVAYDDNALMWRVLFSTFDMLGGCQTVYLSNEGITKLIVYGE